MAENSKFRSGYGRLKAKYAKLKAEKEELEKQLSDKDGIISKQGKTITELTANNATLQADARYYEDASKKYWHAMGIIRRWLYIRKNQ